MAKKLGMGLDLLLGSVSLPDIPPGEVLARVKSTYSQALDQDEQGHVFEAYHLYRQVVETCNEAGAASTSALRRLAAQALNNAAVILYDHNDSGQARCFLQKALELCPDNATARNNLALIEAEEETP